MIHYKTDRMENILSCDKAWKIAGEVSPIYGDSEIGLWFLQAIGTELSTLSQWSDQYAQQIIPQTATWAIPYYEKMYHLPSESDLRLEQRRAALLNVMLTRAPMNPEKLIKILNEVINDAGITVRLIENTGKNRFCIDILENGNPIPYRKIREKIETVKPAHLLCHLIFTASNSAEHQITVCVNFGVHADAKARPNVSARSQFVANCLVETESTSRLTAEIDMWRLNGSVSLDGTKIINAHTETTIL